MNIFFTSDTHYGHKNILKYCNRPYSTVEEMDETLITNYNSVVKPNDIVYHLGDFSWSTPSLSFKRLNGKKHLILGNHDDFHKHKDVGWEWIKNYYELKHNSQLTVLFHYGQRVWNKSHHGSFMLFGHSHGKLPSHGKSFDIGVDCHNYFPISFEQVQEKMKDLEIVKDFSD